MFESTRLNFLYSQGLSAFVRKIDPMRAWTLGPQVGRTTTLAGGWGSTLVVDLN